MNDIDWYALGHAYGDASDVPDMLRRLLSPERDRRDEAWSELFGSVRHQGDIYDSTPVVVPFLVELLEHPDVRGKDEILQAVRYWAPDTWSERLRLEDFEGTGYAAQTCRAIAEGLPVYRKLLQHEDSEVRVQAARLLTLCVPESEIAGEAVREALLAEGEPAARRDLALTLAVFKRPQDAAALKALAVRETDPAMKLASALGWMYVAGEASDEAAGIVIDCAGSTENPFHEIPREEWIVGEALRCMGERAAIVYSRLAGNPVEEIRFWALSPLAAFQTEESARRIAECLCDSESRIRWLAASLLGEHELRSRPSVRLARRETGPEPDVRGMAVEALLRRLPDEPAEHVRDQIVISIGEQAPWAESAVGALRSVAESDKSERVRATTERVLSQISALLGGCDVEALFSFLEGTGHPRADTAAGILARIGRDRPESVAPHIILGLQGPPVQARQFAELAGMIGPPATDVIPALEKCLSSRSPDTRQAAFAALRRIAGQSDPWRDISKDEIRKRLGTGASEKLIELVQDLLDDDNSYRQREATWELAQMGGDAGGALPFLLEAMDRPYLRHLAAGAVSRIEPERIRALLPELLRSFRSSKLQGDFDADALPFVGYLGPELHADVIAFLMDCLPESGETPRTSAKMIPYALSKLAEADAALLTPLVLRLLQTKWSEDSSKLPSQVETVLKVLKQGGRRFGDVFPVVAGLYERATGRTRVLVLETMARIGSPEVMQSVLREAAESEDVELSRMAERFLFASSSG